MHGRSMQAEPETGPQTMTATTVAEAEKTLPKEQCTPRVLRSRGP